jgi:DNA mismatch endonuclease (patch repair protein)
MDVVDVATRSRMMSGIRGKNTRPEIAVRGLLHAEGFRFRLHRKDLPGNPDIVLSRYRTVILVHGCFWHSHSGCRLAKLPASNAEFWSQKLENNHARDLRKTDELLASGWRVLVVWECATRLRELRATLQAELSEWILGDFGTGEIPRVPLPPVTRSCQSK